MAMISIASPHFVYLPACRSPVSTSAAQNIEQGAAYTSKGEWQGQRCTPSLRLASTAGQRR